MNKGMQSKNNKIWR